MGKNVKKVISLVLVFVMILTGMTFNGLDAKAAGAANDTSAAMKFIQPREVLFTRMVVLLWQIRQTLSVTARSMRRHRNV